MSFSPGGLAGATRRVAPKIVRGFANTGRGVIHRGMSKAKMKLQDSEIMREVRARRRRGQ